MTEKVGAMMPKQARRNKTKPWLKAKREKKGTPLHLEAAFTEILTEDYFPRSQYPNLADMPHVVAGAFGVNPVIESRGLLP